MLALPSYHHIHCLCNPAHGLACIGISKHYHQTSSVSHTDTLVWRRHTLIAEMIRHGDWNMKTLYPPERITLVEPKTGLHNETDAEHKEDNKERNVLRFMHPPDAWLPQRSSSFIVWPGGCSLWVHRCGVWVLHHGRFDSASVIAALHHTLRRSQSTTSK